MTTFLQLCQDTAELSGTIPTIGQPEAVTGQSGRLQRIINFVIRAHNDVQRLRTDWRWMVTEFSAPTIIDTQTYSAASLGISERFSRWVHFNDEGEDTFSLYLAADGQETEGYLTYVDWPDFRRLFMVGGAAIKTGKPSHITVNDQRELVLYPIPDAAYTLRGRYRKSPRVWTSGDGAVEPEFPEEYHDAVTWRALMHLMNFDEANEQYSSARLEYDRLISELVNVQTPRIIKRGALG